MKRILRNLLLTGVLAIPVGFAAPAQACDPEHQNPCDIQPYEVPDLYCKVLKKC